MTVNHQRVGNGPVYLGTYYFHQGRAGHVEVSNRSDDLDSVVIADMIRFGNGMGDINRGGGISGRERGDEAGLYWVDWHVSRCQGIPTSVYRATDNDRQATVSLAPRYSAYMNRVEAGKLSDRVLVSFHSNAGAGSSRGVLGLMNGNNRSTAATPNQLLLARTLALEVNDDLVALNGQFEHDWFDRGRDLTLDRTDIEFGEINNERIGNEFDATIVETAFHDNRFDTELMREPRVRDAIARATYQGVVKYFHKLDSNSPAAIAPARVTNLQVAGSEDGGVTLRWNRPVANAVVGDAPTGYVVYKSTNGYGFDGGRLVKGPDQTEFTMTNLPAGTPLFFQVVAINEGGESPPSEVVACISNTGSRPVLIVNGFDPACPHPEPATATSRWWDDGPSPTATVELF